MMLLQPALEVSQWHLEPSIDGHFKVSLCSLLSVATHMDLRRVRLSPYRVSALLSGLSTVANPKGLSHA